MGEVIAADAALDPVSHFVPFCYVALTMLGLVANSTVRCDSLRIGLISYSTYSIPQCYVYVKPTEQWFAWYCVLQSTNVMKIGLMLQNGGKKRNIMK